MGILVELPVSRKKRILLAKTNKVAKETDESWQWGAFERQLIEEAMSRPTLRTVPTDALADYPGSFKQLISPSAVDSSSSPSPTSFFTASSGFSSSDSSTDGKDATQLLKAKNKSEMQGLELLASSLPRDGEDCRPSRWDSDRWSTPNSSFQDRLSTSTTAGRSMCKCAAGLTADVAAICCCPFSVLHLFAIAFIKLPSALLAKTLAKVKTKITKKRNRAPGFEEDNDSVVASSYPPSRSRSYEACDIQTWTPEVGFGDQMLWRDCFESPDSGSLSSGDLRRSKP